MRDWADFFPDVLPAVELGTPEPTVVHQLRRAAQDFCHRTRAWRTTLEPITTEDGLSEYAIPLPEQTTLVRLEGAELLGHGSLVLWRQGPGQGQYLMTPDARRVRLHRPVAADLALLLDVTLKPGDAAMGVDDAVFDYSEVIALGAVARLRGDPVLRGDFNARCETINVEVWRGRAAVRPRVRPYF
ncbi:hypothetical protein CTTA_4930 [Comamonas testosteroni]|uniref:Uncharacterized protein n=1 Tax=Comamonas testosteroni TaxID=285 RepID=A0A5A7MMI8_COMTE|nr:hypothetical protein [Comamonas testosteroni]GEQ77925.1 hypothetical protein CTTA_4930 [Comamonas testosteroni]